MALARLAAPLVLVAATLVLGGCGSGGSASSSHSSASRPRVTTRQHASPATPAVPPNPVPARRPHAADARTVTVIRHWADALRRGDVRGAARVFEIPSVFAPGPDQEVTIHSLAQAEAANAGLPCGAKLISVIKLGGPLVQALFRLTGRPGPAGARATRAPARPRAPTSSSRPAASGCGCAPPTSRGTTASLRRSPARAAAAADPPSDPVTRRPAAALAWEFPERYRPAHPPGAPPARRRRPRRCDPRARSRSRSFRRSAGGPPLRHPRPDRRRA